MYNLYNVIAYHLIRNQGYDDDQIKQLLKDYMESCSDETNFFINQNSIFLIVPVSGANSTYIIVEAAR